MVAEHERGASTLHPYQPRVRAVDTSAGRVRVAEVGTGQPLLLINGIGASLEMWRPLARRLSDARRLILFDVPGTGGSGRLRRPLRMPGMAQLVVELLDELGDGEVDVLGYSWGGAVAQQLAMDAPGRVRRLVLVATSPGRGGKAPSLPVLALMSTPLQFVSESYLTRIAPRVFGGDTFRSGTAPRAPARSFGRPPTQLGYAQQLYAISGWTSLPWLSRLAAPTLVISGDDDPLVPMKNARVLAGRIRHARLQVIPHGGHLWLLEHADASAALIAEFLG
ncbi:MAG TPA: alpha/beta fold hydrolase [Jatrophihabitans sp.]|nr:alpha/beta fold hydrolase [Jatrophihabitans sp.]